MAAKAQSATELADELGKLDIKTDNGKKVWARVTNIYGTESGRRIVVEAELVTGETVKQTYEKPTPWSLEYEFVRFVERYGYDASSFDNLIGEEISLTTGDGDWQIRDPGKPDDESADSVRIGFAKLLFVVGWTVAVWPVLGDLQGSLILCAVVAFATRWAADYLIE